MINFQEISPDVFLNEYWQKKPFVIRKALTGFNHPVSPDELAGLALEEDLESRLVFETPGQKPQWHLKRGPFQDNDFGNLPKTHWTLLVQGVDRVIPGVYALLDHFDFIPQWRIDDVMISYAVEDGSVGPHYDNYDVFLYQAKGRREWFLTSQNCTPENYITDLELRIMNEFTVEQHFILEEGDMLYLPPHSGHYGISRSPECMTYSFGYRSYQGQEVWDSLGDYISENECFKNLYQDPAWAGLKNTAELPEGAWQKAQELMQTLLANEQTMKTWFGCFATRLDQSAEQHLPEPLEDDELITISEFIAEVNHNGLSRDSCCRFAYQTHTDSYQLFINGCKWDTQGVSNSLISTLANHRILPAERLRPYLDDKNNQQFLFDLWKLQWLQLEE